MSQHNAEYHRRWRVENRERLNARKPKSYTGCYDIARQRFDLFVELTKDGTSGIEEALPVLDAQHPFPNDSYEQERLKRGD